MLLRKAFLLAIFAFAAPVIKSQGLLNGALPPLNLFDPLASLTPTTTAPKNTANHASGPLSFSALPIPNKSRQRDVFNHISEGSQAFALEMFVRLSDLLTRARKDFILSPFAIWSLLLPLSEGADGNTLEEIRNTLHLKDDQKILRDAYRTIKAYLRLETPTIQIASLQAIFTDINRPVNREFENIIELFYGADHIPLNFQNPDEASFKANGELQKSTRGLIQYAIQPSDFENANLLLVSSLFFKGQWKLPFNKSFTHKEPFHDEQGNQIGNVDMMMQIGNFNFTGMNDLEGHVLELPYGYEDRLSMLIILPKKGVSISQVAHNLQRIGIEPIFEKLAADAVGYEDEEVEVHMPKFSTTSDFSMHAILSDMGIRDLFEPHFANLSKISDNLFVSAVVHSAKIIVDEEGTTAAAVAAAVLSNKATPPKFYLNRPFIYLIIEKNTKALLFCGHIMNPNNIQST